MKTSMKKKLAIALVSIMVILLTACTEADTVSENISKAADSFEVHNEGLSFSTVSPTSTYLPLKGYAHSEITTVQGN